MMKNDKKMKTGYLIWMLCFGALVFASCSDDDELDMEQVYAEERATILEYLAEHAKGDVIKHVYTYGNVTDTLYVFDVEGGNGLAGDAEWALVDYDIFTIGRLTGEKNLFDTSDPAYSAGENIDASYSMGGPVYWSTNPQYVDGVLLSYVKEGGSGKVIIPSRLLMQNGVARLYEMEVHEFIDGELLAHEYELMEGFVKDKIGDGLVPTLLPLHEGETAVSEGDTLSYLYYVGEAHAENEGFVEGDTARAFLRAYIVDEYNDPLREVFQVEEDENGNEVPVDVVVSDDMLRGLRLAFEHLHVGDEAWVLMPSAMAWGVANDLLGIPPYSTIAYWMKIDSKAAKK